MPTLDRKSDTEHERVIAWRRAQLARAGFDPHLAARVAHSWRMDLHALLDLVDRGCPPELAVRILAPLGDEGDRW